jgi:hypothetical protein
MAQPQRPLPQAIPIMNNQNIYGDLHIGNGINATIDFNGGTLYEPVIEQRHTAELTPGSGRKAGQIVYDMDKQQFAYYDGAVWVYMGGTQALTETHRPCRFMVNDGILPANHTNVIDTNYTANNGDRVLFNNNELNGHASNGIYYWNGSSFSRATDMDESAEFPGSLVIVMEGTEAKRDTIWLCSSDTNFVKDTSPAIFVQIQAPASYIFGKGLVLNANVVDIDIVPDSGLEFIGADDEDDQLDVKLHGNNSGLTKAAGLQVSVDGNTVQLINNQLVAKYGFIHEQYAISGQNGTYTKTITAADLIGMTRFTKIENVEFKHISGDSRLENNVIFEAFKKIDNTNKEVTISFSAVTNGNYLVIIYGY